MLMQKYVIDAEQAFAILAQQSQHANKPLYEVALALVEHRLED